MAAIWSKLLAKIPNKIPSTPKNSEAKIMQNNAYKKCCGNKGTKIDIAIKVIIPTRKPRKTEAEAKAINIPLGPIGGIK